MKSPGVVFSSTGTPSVFVSTGRLLNTSASTIQSKSEDFLVLSARIRGSATSTNANSISWRLSNRGPRKQWFQAGLSMRLQPAPPLEGPLPERDAVTRPAATAAAAEPQPTPKPARTERIELAIDSLQNYEVLKPIPVLIEPLGDRVFVAEAPDLNLSTSSSSVGAAFLTLKEHITTTYEGYRGKKGLDSERARQLAVMEQFIGKSKRHWF